MVPVMSAEDIHDATETFARYGVPADRIFNEVMRARYLDYVLFLNPENVQYGISIDDLYENMKKTSDRLGMYEGDEDTYVKAYTLALRVDPMVFAPDIPEGNEKLQLLLAEAVEKAKKAESTVLFSGVEGYMIYLAHIADQLPDKRLAFAVKRIPEQDKIVVTFTVCHVLVLHPEHPAAAKRKLWKWQCLLFFQRHNIWLIFDDCKETAVFLTHDTRTHNTAPWQPLF